MAGDVIKEFLVALGFQVNQDSLKRTTQSISNIEKEAKKLSTTEKQVTKEIDAEYLKRVAAAEVMGKRIATVIVGMANLTGKAIANESRAFAAFAQSAASAATRISASMGVAATAFAANFALVTRSLNELNNVSMRTGAGVKSITEFEHAIQRLGGTSNDALGAIEGLSSKMQENRGVNAMLRSWGVTAEDTVEKLLQLAPILRGENLDVAIQRGSLLGLSPEQVRLLRSGDLNKSMEHTRTIMRAWGVDQNSLAKDAKAVADGWRDMMLHLSLLNQSFLSGLFGANGAFGGANSALIQFAERFGPAVKEFGQNLATWLAGGADKVIEWLRDPESMNRLVAALKAAGKEASDFAKSVASVAKSLATIAGILAVPFKLGEGARGFTDALGATSGGALSRGAEAAAGAGGGEGGGGLLSRAWGATKRFFGGGGGGSGGGGKIPAVPDIQGMTADEKNKLGLILKYESKGQNVMNYVGRSQGLNPTTPKGYTAQGYYQILNSNWARLAPKLGIKEPNAMAASFEDQTKVALALMRENPNASGGGIRNWANYNPSLASALRRGEQVAASALAKVGAAIAPAAAAAPGINNPGRFDVNNVPSSAVSNDNSKSVTQTNNFNTQITGSDPILSASSFQKASENLGGITTRQLTGAIR